MMDHAQEKTNFRSYCPLKIHAVEFNSAIDVNSMNSNVWLYETKPTIDSGRCLQAGNGAWYHMLQPHRCNYWSKIGCTLRSKVNLVASCGTKQLFLFERTEHANCNAPDEVTILCQRLSAANQALIWIK